MQPHPFYKTSEFWLSVVGNLFGVWQQMRGHASPYGELVGGIIQAASTGGYAVSRGLAKYQGPGPIPK